MRGKDIFANSTRNSAGIGKVKISQNCKFEVRYECYLYIIKFLISPLKCLLTFALQINCFLTFWNYNWPKRIANLIKKSFQTFKGNQQLQTTRTLSTCSFTKHFLLSQNIGKISLSDPMGLGLTTSKFDIIQNYSINFTFWQPYPLTQGNNLINVFFCSKENISRSLLL